MNQTERIYKIKNLLSCSNSSSFESLRLALEVSRATLTRDLTYMRDRLNVPIKWSRVAGGYCLESSPSAEQIPNGHANELPGLWFSSSEVLSLLAMEQFLAKVDQGANLTPLLQPLKARLKTILGDENGEADQLRNRVRILGLAQRRLEPQYFQTVAAALVQRKRLRISYKARSDGQETDRDVSPLRLIHYRENWHLDAWCHLRKQLRNFAVDRIHGAKLLSTAAKEVSNDKLDAHFNPSYGIFAGGRVQWARLRFTADRSEWVKDQLWHPEQKSRVEADGSYFLQIPFTDHRELLMDILQHGSHCQVLGPTKLREVVVEELRRMTAKYF